MPYRAFVSSTFEDLREHRKLVIDALRQAGIDADVMEEYSASSKAPREFCADRMKRCNVCILLVAFRRGDFPPSEQVSFTQIEYEEARKQHIDVLPFLLKDSPENAAVWKPEYDDRKRDDEINIWRALLKRRHIVRDFDASPKSLNIDAAITSWVVEIESARAHRFRRKVMSGAVGAVVVLLALLSYISFAYHTPVLRKRYLSHFLAYHDPQIFNSSSDGQYELARVLDSYGTLQKETHLSDEISGTKKSFDMLVNNGQYIRQAQKENFLNIVRRGGKLRIILWDYSESNRPAYDAFTWAIGQNPEETREGAKNVHSELRQWKAQVDHDRKQFPGSFDFRWNTKPLFYTMWIRDWGETDAIGHLGVHFYRGQEYFPNFRVSMRDSDKMLKNMHDEFELAWKDAKDLDLGK
jgi:hypothetical protein